MMPSTYKHITLRGQFVEAPLNPCPWCKKTPDLRMPLDQAREVQDKTWVWRISCTCMVSSEATVSIRKTSKTNLTRFLDKVNELFGKWNENNPVKAYEKKILDLKMIPNLGIK